MPVLSDLPGTSANAWRKWDRSWMVRVDLWIDLSALMDFVALNPLINLTEEIIDPTESLAF